MIATKLTTGNLSRIAGARQARRAWALTTIARAASLAVLAGGCYTGSARGVAGLPDVDQHPGWVLVRGVPFVHQQSEADCGAAAMAMALSYWGQPATLAALVAAQPPHDGGITAGELRDLARARALQAFLVPGTFVDLDTQLRRGRPVVVGLAKPITGNRALQHYEVVIGLNRAEGRVLTWDPAQGLRENSLEGFAREWIPAHQLALILFPRTTACGEVTEARCFLSRTGVSRWSPGCNESLRDSRCSLGFGDSWATARSLLESVAFACL